MLVIADCLTVTKMARLPVFSVERLLGIPTLHWDPVLA